MVEDPLENNKTITTLHNSSTEKHTKNKNTTKINLDNFDINKDKIENIKTTKYQTESVDKYQTESVNKYQTQNADKTKVYTENINITKDHAENTIGNILYKGIINIAENHADNADLSRGDMENIRIIKVANFLFKSEISPGTEIKKNENGYNYIKRNIQNDFINFEKNSSAHLSKDLQVKVDNEFLKLSLKLTKSFMDTKLPKKTVQNTEIIDNSFNDVKYGIQNKLKSSEIIEVRRNYLFDIELNAIKMNLELSKVESLVNRMTSQVV
ncbi:uncharacterized protein LOC136078335 isoform X1 [Hydra vulgaris]|uniref:Uncharacterized protein LOC136078335 isoform X1 n=1 Tax=Hydra vulgaris TaxID=6087 RepID=A0ABM4BLS6_HYDVU